MKARELVVGGKHVGWMIFCPACGCGHLLNGWTFNGDTERPTFSPSILVHGWETDGTELPGYRIQKRCHSYVTDGCIQYLADCEHALAGQTVELEDF